MAKIKLVETGWSMIPEGNYTFKITKVDYNEDFGKMEISMVTKSGQTHNERFSLITKKGNANEGAMKAFSYFAKTALGNFDVEEIDPADLEGCYLSARVEHVESETISEKTGEPFVNVRLQDTKSAVSFGGDTQATDEEESDEEVDLDDFLD
ncbi:hypothetical protein [Jeotgalibaca porci]|uniref:hypothetical protein n=1 Tax=Jeotgalibaca porci TaxID=1868793 RepID=UPI00359FD36A